MASTLQRSEYPDQFVTQNFNIVAPANVNRLFVADGQWMIDAVRVHYGTKSSVTGAIGWLQKNADANIAAAAVAITSATLSVSTLVWSLTKTGAFVGYTWRAGDRINLVSSSASGFVAGQYAVSSKTSDDAIVLKNIDGTNLATMTGTLTDAVATFNPGVPISGNGVDFQPSGTVAVAGIALDGTANTAYDGTILLGDPATGTTGRLSVADKEVVSFICSTAAAGSAPTALANLCISIRMRNRRR